MLEAVIYDARHEDPAYQRSHLTVPLEPSGPRHVEEALIGGGDDDRPLTGW